MIAIGKRDDTIIGRKYRRNRGNSYRPTDLPEGEATKFITFTWEEIVPMGRRKSGKVAGTEAKIFLRIKKLTKKSARKVIETGLCRNDFKNNCIHGKKGLIRRNWLDLRY